MDSATIIKMYFNNKNLIKKKAYNRNYETIFKKKSKDLNINLLYRNHVFFIIKSN